MANIKHLQGISLPVVGATCGDFTAHTGYEPNRVKAWIQWVTPEQAKVWRDGMADGNRKLRPRRVMTIANDMRNKKYNYTGVPLLFDEDGRGIDGHHRLSACIMADHGFWSTIITGIDRSQALPNVDGIAVKTMADRLTMIHKCENANSAAAISLLIWQFLRMGECGPKSSSWGQPSYVEVEKVYLRYRSEIEWVMTTIGAQIDPSISSGGAPVLAPFVFMRGINRPLMDAAALAFDTGDNLKGENDPMRKLRVKVNAEGAPLQRAQPKIGNKNSSSQFSRFAMSMYTMECLERVLLGTARRGTPKGDPAVLDRVLTMLRTSPTAIKPMRPTPRLQVVSAE